MLSKLLSYLEQNQPIATLLTGILAIFAVIVSQIWLDIRQRRDHRHSYDLKAKEIALKKKEEIIELLGEQVRAISLVEDIFDSWWRDFKTNYSHFKINSLLREIDTRAEKIGFMAELYFPSFIAPMENIRNEAEKFVSLCADFTMAGSFGEDDFRKLNHLEIVEICNSYAVSYSHFTSQLVVRNEVANPIIKNIQH